MRLVTLLQALLLLVTPLAAGASGADDQAALRQQAARITIVRDDWGIAHVHGPTDADAVFGAMYAQAEDDFNRIETNYLERLGMLAQADGQRAIYKDLRARLFVDSNDLKAKYRTSPAWLRSLMDAWANGLNFYLLTHPAVHPKVIAHFEPWMSLSFSDATIGPDIEDVDLGQLQAFYGSGNIAEVAPARRLSFARFGSNGVAIAPKDTANGHALLLINPHTSFFFRSELQMSSDRGLNAYGASTWGEFYIYQGFNEHAGWMHTSTAVNNVDQFAETIVRRDGKLYYRYGSDLRPVTISTIVIPYRTSRGSVARKAFIVFRTHHGPIVASQNGKWLAEALMYRPVEGLESSFSRTKAADWATFSRIAQQSRADSSNNTLFADDKGEIAFIAPTFVARRSNRYDYTKPVDGSNPATDWHGTFDLSEQPNIINPSTGWVFNTNDGPWTDAGSASPKRSDYPAYYDTAGEDARGVHMRMLLSGRHDLSLEALRAIAFDPNLPFFQTLVPSLARAFDALPAGSALKLKLSAPIATLRGWKRRWSSSSVATTLAMFWADELSQETETSDLALLATGPRRQLDAFAHAVDRLDKNFGTWRTPWGQINRFQRLNDSIKPQFDDAQPSIPVPFVSGEVGSLAAYYAAPVSNTKKWYGTDGNTFVAVVEFGPRVRAIAVSAGGESGDPASPHFNDQAVRYATGALRPVYFYPDELAGHTVRTYHPGE